MFEKLFPSELNKDVLYVESLIEKYDFDHKYDSKIKLDFDNREYFNEIPNTEFNKLNSIQKLIYACILTRNYNGYIREKYMKYVLDQEIKEFEIPFIIKLSEEYVVEIVDLIYNRLKGRDCSMIKAWYKSHQKRMDKSISRMISYWNEYYRIFNSDYDKTVSGSLNKIYYNKYSCEHIYDYVGYKLYTEIFGVNIKINRRNSAYTK